MTGSEPLSQAQALALRTQMQQAHQDAQLTALRLSQEGSRQWGSRPVAEQEREAPCEGDSSGWDLDFGGIPEWYAAIESCLSCPLLRACTAKLDETYPGWRNREGGAKKNPAGVIWAGWAFSDSGAVLTAEGLRRVAGTKGVRHASRAERLRAAS